MCLHIAPSCTLHGGMPLFMHALFYEMKASFGLPEQAVERQRQGYLSQLDREANARSPTGHAPVAETR